MIPPLWSDDEVDERDDGYLILKKGLSPDRVQPLLLHSSEVFLKLLYPKMSTAAILAYFPSPLSETETEETTDAPRSLRSSSSRNDNNEHTLKEPNGVDDMEVDSIQDDHEYENDAQEETSESPQKDTSTTTKNHEIPKYQQVYQSLKRCDALNNRIQPLISDLGSFKHRPIKRNKEAGPSSRDAIKVRALEMQQQQLRKKQSTVDSGGTTQQQDTAPPAVAPENDDPVGKDQDGVVDDEPTRQTQLVRLVRTINSIRATYMHLFQIFNHKRRNDNLLRIGDYKWKASKRGGFCWILGSKVFDSSSSKLLIGAYKDCSLILESFISVDTAKSICHDPLGGNAEFWSKSWIKEVKARASPTILDPFTILTSFPNAPDRETLKSRSLECDKHLNLKSNSVDIEQTQAQYDAAVRKLHQKISDLLKERFPEARVSIYGSCLSDLSLGKGADVDLSLWLPKAEELRTDFEAGRLEAHNYEKRMKTFVFQVFHKLKNCGHMFRDLQPITRARVPVVKGTYNHAKNPYSPDGSLK
jgi:hypothetical protein